MLILSRRLWEVKNMPDVGDVLFLLNSIFEEGMSAAAYEIKGQHVKKEEALLDNLIGFKHCFFEHLKLFMKGSADKSSID